MGRGLLLAGGVLGGLALIWSFMILGIFSLVAAGGGALVLLVPFVGFAAGATAVVGGIVGSRQTELGALLLLVAGLAGLLVPAVVIGLNARLDVSLLEAYFASFIVSWWAYFLVLVGGLTFLASRRAGGATTQAGGPGG